MIPRSLDDELLLRDILGLLPCIFCSSFSRKCLCFVAASASSNLFNRRKDEDDDAPDSEDVRVKGGSLEARFMTSLSTFAFFFFKSFGFVRMTLLGGSRGSGGDFFAGDDIGSIDDCDGT